MVLKKYLREKNLRITILFKYFNSIVNYPIKEESIQRKECAISQKLKLLRTLDI